MRGRGARAWALAFLAGAAGCGGEDPTCGTRGGSLQATLDRIVATGSTDELSLSEVVPSDWDRVYLFPAHADVGAMPVASGLGPVPEDSNLLVFTLAGEPRCHELVTLPSGEEGRGWGFAGRIFLREGIARSDAVFRIVRGEGFDELALIEAR